MRNIDLFTMGCSKNLVDSEQLLAQLHAAGYRVWHDPEQTHGEVAVVNTCGFIGDAKEESINMILRLCSQKEEGFLSRVYVMGCLSQRYCKELRDEIPQVDGYYGKFSWKELLADLGESYDPSLKPSRQLTTPSHYAYIKISEGCDRHCAYCAIPIITGRHKSRAMEDIAGEVEQLVGQGVAEFQIIAQELTYYGVDRYHRRAIAELVDRLAGISGVRWLRLHYAYPTDFPLELLDVMAKHPNVCKYLDIALQHISTNVLQRMQRHITKEQTLDLLSQMRRRVPGIAIRTTLMVGFPGETEQDFQELLDFVRQQRFDRMGAFAYSEEEGTPAARLYEDNVPEEVKQRRLDRLMKLQEGISAQLCQEKVGRTLLCVIDRHEGDYYVGRTQADSPEVDCEVLLPAATNSCRPGTFCHVLITKADEFDLYGEVV